jgi:hypothetical protein
MGIRIRKSWEFLMEKRVEIRMKHAKLLPTIFLGNFVMEFYWASDGGIGECFLGFGK